MAAPTMQPVKNFAFIKCDSVMEYDLLPAYLKGADQFIFADVPTTRPDARPGTKWVASSDPEFSAADGWEVNQFIEYTETYTEAAWVSANLYRFYWNNASGEHRAKVLRGKAYSDESANSWDHNDTGRLFLVKASYTYTTKNSITYKDLNLSSGTPGTYSIGIVDDTILYCGQLTSDPEPTHANVSSGGFWYGNYTVFLETGEVNSEFTGFGQPTLIPDIDTEQYFPTTEQGLSDIGDTSGVVWTKVDINSDNLPMYINAKLQGYTDPGRYEFGIVVPSYTTVDNFQITSAHQWYSILDNTNWDTVGGRSGSIKKPVLDTTSKDEIQLARIYKSTRSSEDSDRTNDFDKLYDLSCRAINGNTGFPLRGASLFYRKKMDASVYAVGSVIDTIPFKPIAAAECHLTDTSNHLEGGIQGLRENQIFCLYAAYNDPASTASTTTIPHASYLRIGSDRCSFTQAKLFNTGLIDINGNSLSRAMWYKLTDAPWNVHNIDMGRTSVWVSRPLRLRWTHRNSRDAGVYFATRNGFSWNSGNAYITSNNYTFGILTAAGRLLDSRMSDELLKCKALSTVTGTASDSAYYKDMNYIIISGWNENWKHIDTDCKLVLYAAGDYGTTEFDLYVSGDTSTYEGWVKMDAAGTEPMPRSTTDISNGVKSYRTPSPVVVLNGGSYMTYKVYTINLKKMFEDNPSFSQLAFQVRGAFTQEQVDEMEGHNIKFGVAVLDPSEPINESLDGSIAAHEASLATDIDAKTIDV